jgi:chemosensory pili system protein ChpA (sensor histidine kinase/response regulator)
MRDATPSRLDVPSQAKQPASLHTSFGGFGQADLRAFTELPVEATRIDPSRADAVDGDDDIDAVDAVDAELFPIFEEEGQELLAQLGSRLRDWSRRPSEMPLASACMRTLHTLKGGARLAGAMRLGEMAHRLETAIEHLLAVNDAKPSDLDALQARADALNATFEILQARDASAYVEAGAAHLRPDHVEPFAESVPGALEVPVPESEFVLPTPELVVPHKIDAELLRIDLPALSAAARPAPTISTPQAAAARESGAATDASTDIDWARFMNAPAARAVVADRVTSAASQSAVRVRAALLERLVNQAGEVSITRSRIESEVGQIKGSLGDLTDNLERLRGQLRDIELQAEMQMASRMEAAKAAAETFDPLEFDRFTRFQELTRMMAESVNDVATVQRTLQRTLEATEDELAAQTRLTRDLQDDLLRTRMVEFEGLSDRLYRVARQAAKETGKHVRLDIVGGSIEVDRGVLDRMTGAFEHLLRNSVTHGIEMPDVRTAAGKDPTGTLIVAMSHEGNEVGVEFRDDGQGLNLDRIREKGTSTGLLDPAKPHTDAEIANLIFTPGFSTADVVTELAGRGIGMDVVRSEVNAMGGRIETATSRGHGTSFKLVLPLTTAVTQVVMLRCAEATVAVPSTLVEIVRRATPAEMTQAYATGSFTVGDRQLPFFWLGALLQMSPRPLESGRRTYPVVVIRSAQQRIVVHIDDVLGNHEVVVKNLGPQLSRMPGLAGMTLLASGVPALIYNPVALATLYGESARAATIAALTAPADVVPVKVESQKSAPLILVVDDSLTVRRITQRLLVREGYRVMLAKDGLDALERLAEETPAMVLSDIEMPRMDGFDLVRNLRGDARWRELPVIMITSRIAQKHRDHAGELGVDHYLGKPYAEEDLLALIGRYISAEVTS